MIEQVVSLRKKHDFRKSPKKSYDTENFGFNQLDFSINYMMFVTAQYKLVDQFDDKDEYMRLNMRCHAVLGMK